MAVEPETRKREIEARYAALCARVEAAAEAPHEDAALREAFAELAAMMIAYAHDTGAQKAIMEALSRNPGRSGGDRLSLAARALQLLEKKD